MEKLSRFVPEPRQQSSLFARRRLTEVRKLQGVHRGEERRETSAQKQVVPKQTELLISTWASAEPPDIGEDSIIGTAAVVGTFLGGALWLLVTRDLEGLERAALFGGLAGAGAGLLLYLVALAGGLL
jgi:hypothetical protein